MYSLVALIYSGNSYLLESIVTREILWPNTLWNDCNEMEEDKE